MRVVRCRALSLCLLLCLLTWWSGCRCQASPGPEQGTGSHEGRSDDARQPMREELRPDHVHKTTLAGTWYPDRPEELRSMIGRFLAEASLPEALPKRSLAGLVVPHAGYLYSGPVAACAYRLLASAPPRRVVLVGPSHRSAFRGLALSDAGVFETPLGQVRVDLEACRRLLGCPLVGVDREAHRFEHSVDIQLPFLQVALPRDSFQIVPLLVGNLQEEDSIVLGRTLADLLDDATILVISSDFTHYGPRYGYVPFPPDGSIAERLRRLDEGAWSRALALDRKSFDSYCRETGATICGARAIGLLLEALPKGAEGRLLCYGTSADVTGDFENVVGYVALAFFRTSPASAEAPNPAGKEPKSMKKEPPSSSGEKVEIESVLTPSEKQTLLRLARDTLESYVREGRMPDPLGGAYEITENLRAPRGAFVTLKKHGTLRGCIGYILPREPLYVAVQENAVNAACRDSRFPRVKPEELDDIQIEISALSPPRAVESYEDIQIGTHGILLRKGGAQAVFLPQVAPEQGWGLQETLRQLSLKAGLPRDAWKDPDTRFSVFTAEVFEEHS
jgi:AmmeMemoRadiSam system protein B/AmmeMemoRadiSam system protein A